MPAEDINGFCVALVCGEHQTHTISGRSRERNGGTEAA
jgi:hypothetical protein